MILVCIIFLDYYFFLCFSIFNIIQFIIRTTIILATANMINQMQPTDLAAMTYTPVPGTKMYQDIEQGNFHVLNDTECLIETRELVKNLQVPDLHFTSNHASNYVSIDGVLPKDKETILHILDKAIAGNIPKRNSFQRGL